MCTEFFTSPDSGIIFVSMTVDQYIKNPEHFNVISIISIRDGNLARIVKVDSLAKIKNRE